jgi:hypothetical protein
MAKYTMRILKDDNDDESKKPVNDNYNDYLI